MPLQQPPECMDLCSNHQSKVGLLDRTANQGLDEGFCAKVAAAQKPLVLNIYLCKATTHTKKLHSPNGLWVA